MDPARTFDGVAEQYEQSRPGYPAQMYEDLAALAGLGGRATVLEVGPGTGQATRGLLAQGWRVTALEPGAELARVARRVLHGDVTVEVTSFEDWTGDGPFDLVFAATSWHWVDPAVGFRRAAELSDRLAIVHTVHVLPADGDPFFRDVQEVYEEVGMGDGGDGPAPPEAVPDPDFGGGDEWDAPAVRRYVTAWDYTADEYLALIGTYSNHIAATPERTDRLYAEIRRRIGPGRVRKHYLTVLQVARRGTTGS